MPVKPPLRRGPRRQASSSARTRCRKALRCSPPWASGCLSVASRATGLTPSTIRRAQSRRNPPGGVWSSGVPAESSTSICQRRSSIATRRARCRSGRHQRRGPPRRLERRAHPQRQRQRLARQIGMLLDDEPLEGCRRRRRQALPGVDGGARPHHLGQEARAGRIAAGDALAPASARPRRAPRRAPPAAASGRIADGRARAAASSARRDPDRGRAAPPCRAAGRRSPAAARGSPGCCRSSRRRRSARAAAPRASAGRARSADGGAARPDRAPAPSASTVRPGLGDHRQHRAALLPVLGERVRHQAVERGERHPLGLQLVEQRRELAGEPQRMLERPVERRQQARQQQLAAQRRRSPAAAPARACRRAAARRPRSRRSAGSAAAAAAGRRRGAGTPRRGCGRRAGSAAGPGRRRAPRARPATSASRPAASASTNGRPAGMVAIRIGLLYHRWWRRLLPSICAGWRSHQAPQRRQHRMAQRAREMRPHPRLQVEILALAVALGEAREQAEDLGVALGAEHRVGGAEGVADRAPAAPPDSARPSRGARSGSTSRRASASSETRS